MEKKENGSRDHRYCRLRRGISPAPAFLFAPGRTGPLAISHSAPLFPFCDPLCPRSFPERIVLTLLVIIKTVYRHSSTTVVRINKTDCTSGRLKQKGATKSAGATGIMAVFSGKTGMPPIRHERDVKKNKKRVCACHQDMRRRCE